MNNYGDWWSTTITLYNKVVDRETKKVSWYKHIIDDCFYSHTLDRITINNTTLTADVAICRIRVSDDYVTKRAYTKLSERERQDVFTLSPGDIIVADEIDFDIDEYTKGQRSSDLIAEYKEDPGCFTVQEASNNTGNGRGNEHYYARGV